MSSRCEIQTHVLILCENSRCEMLNMIVASDFSVRCEIGTTTLFPEHIFLGVHGIG